MANGQRVPIEPGIVARVARGMRYAFNGTDPTDAWFGPQEPLDPLAPQAIGRQFDYPVGYNQQIQPRAYEAISFPQLRNLADSYDLLRLLIETRKDQICNLDWRIAPKEKSTAPEDPVCKTIQAALQTPDLEHGWQEWLRMLLEDMLVIDAATIYPRGNLGGGLYALELVDGATIKRVIDITGRTPMPPDPAYQQILKGVPAVDYTRDELIYVPRNPRTNRLYGYSPVEQIIMTVNIALRRQVHQLQFYTEGSIPEALIGVPPEWTPDNIRQFQTYFDDMLAGNTAERRRARFVPGNFKVFETKAGAMKDEMDDWLARVCCFCFSVEPTPFVKQSNKAVSDTAREQSLAEGVVPIRNWVKSVMNRIIATEFGRADLGFTWVDEQAIDPLIQAQINQIYVNAGVLDPDEVRVDTLGKPPLTPEQHEKKAPPPMPAPPPNTMQDGMQEPGPVNASPAPAGGKPGSDDKLDENGKPLKKKHRHPY